MTICKLTRQIFFWHLALGALHRCHYNRLMRLLSYNILDGGLGRADPLAEIIEASRPDVVTLLEADDQSIVERIAYRLKMDIVYARGKRHSAAILSRLPIAESVNFAPLAPEITGSFVTATIAVTPGQLMGIAAVHLHPHATMKDEQIRIGEIVTVLQRLNFWREGKMPHLLAGDFNANSPIQKIDRAKVKPGTQKHMDANAGQIPRLAITRLLRSGYVDTLHAHAGDKAAEMGSFSTHHPGQRVDFIFAHGLEHHQITSAWIETDRLATYASDHYPVGAEISVSV